MQGTSGQKGIALFIHVNTEESIRSVEVAGSPKGTPRFSICVGKTNCSVIRGSNSGYSEPQKGRKGSHMVKGDVGAVRL